jgi:hypothetical protein
MPKVISTAARYRYDFLHLLSGGATKRLDVVRRRRERAPRASHATEAPAKRRASARVGESEGRSPSDRKGGELDAAQTLDDPGSGALPLRLPTLVLGMT